MNERDAIDLASINSITVSTDNAVRVKLGGKWVRRTTFRVGRFLVERDDFTHLWSIVGVSPRTYRRGEAIAECVRLILEARQDQCE